MAVEPSGHRKLWDRAITYLRFLHTPNAQVCLQRPFKTTTMDRSRIYATATFAVGHVRALKYGTLACNAPCAEVTRRLPVVAEPACPRTTRRNAHLDQCYRMDRQSYITCDTNTTCVCHAASRSDPKKSMTRTPGDVLALAWHPDGTKLLLSHRSGRVSMHDTRRIGRTNSSSSRPPELLGERNLNWELNAMQFTADGRSILAAYGDSSGGGVRLLAVSSFTPYTFLLRVLPAFDKFSSSK